MALLTPAIVSCLLECPLAPPTRAPVHTVGLWDGPGEDLPLGAGVIRSKGTQSRGAGATSQGRVLRLSKQGVTHGSFFLRWGKVVGGGSSRLMREEASPGAHLEFLPPLGCWCLGKPFHFFKPPFSHFSLLAK